MGLWKEVGRFFTGGAVDTVTLEAVQRMLVEADFGVAATNETVEKLSRADTVDQASLERIVAEQLGPPAAPLARAPEPPTVILIFGVNGTGKTTSVAKLARRLQGEGRSVLLAAADTFRAGATEHQDAGPEGNDQCTQFGAPTPRPAVSSSPPDRRSDRRAGRLFDERLEDARSMLVDL